MVIKATQNLFLDFHQFFSSKLGWGQILYFIFYFQFQKKYKSTTYNHHLKLDQDRKNKNKQNKQKILEPAKKSWKFRDGNLGINFIWPNEEER